MVTIFFFDFHFGRKNGTLCSVWGVDNLYTCEPCYRWILFTNLAPAKIGIMQMMEYCTLFQLVAPTVAAVSGIVSLLEKTITA